MTAGSNDPPTIVECPDITTTTHIWTGDEIQVDKIVKNYYIIEVTESEDGELIEEPVLVTEIDTVEYLHGLKLIESDYGTYLYNAHGDVTAIVGMIEPQLGGDEVFGIIASYDYDPFGMPPVARSLIRDIDMADEIMNGFGGNQLMGRAGDDAAGLRINRADDNNPFRYCGEYLDIETGYIYLRARYYDPSIGRFISEDSAKDGLNWYAYCANNPIRYIDPSGLSSWQNPFSHGYRTAATIAEIESLATGTDVAIDYNLVFGDLGSIGTPEAQMVMGAGLLLTGAGTGVGLSMLISGAIGLASKTISPRIGQAAGGVGSIVNGAGALRIGSSMMSCSPLGFVLGVSLMAVGLATMAFGVNEIAAAATGANYIQEVTGMSDTAYGLSYVGLNIVSGLGQMAGQKLKDSGKACFVAGTLVSAAFGQVAIENIKAGDLVWASNPETGEKALKEVVQTFVNETYELVHITANGETITTTPKHPFYSPVKGWTAAKSLRAGDKLLLLNGKIVVVEFVQHELIESPVTVYNFEVADFHTYFVGENSVLVHNTCFDPNQRAVIDLAKESKAGLSRQDANTLVSWAKEYGINNHAPMIHPNRRGIWSYTEHMKIFNIHIPIIG